MKQLGTDICPGSAGLKCSESEHCSYIFSAMALKEQSRRAALLSMKTWSEQEQSTLAMCEYEPEQEFEIERARVESNFRCAPIPASFLSKSPIRGMLKKYWRTVPGRVHTKTN